MAINKLTEFASSDSANKDTTGLDIPNGFPKNIQPARQWFNYLFNSLTTKINEIIDKKLDLSGGSLTGAINEAAGAAIASASTVDLTNATGNFVHITGTTSIATINLVQGASRRVVFDGILTLTNGANLILPGGANITTAAGDSVIFVGDASSVVRCVSYVRADGTTVGGTPSKFDNTNKPATTAFVQQAQSSIAGAFSNLKISTIGVSNYNSAITANSVVLKNAAGNSYLAQSVSATGNINTTGANGLDTGTLAASTWYNLFLIYNPTTQTTAALFSLSATAPTLPSGYTFSARVGAVRTDSSGSKYLLNTLQYGKRVQYVVTTGSNTPNLPVMAQDAIGTWSATLPIYASVSTSNFVPPTAVEIGLKVSKFLNSTGSYVGIAPNANYSGVTTSNPPVYSADSAAAYDNSSISLLLESSNIYAYSSSAGGLIQCLGWEDNL